MGEAQKEKKGQAKAVVNKVYDTCCNPNDNDSYKSNLRHLMPLYHLCFTKPIEIVIKVGKRNKPH